MSDSEELTLHGFDKCIHYIKIAPITKEQISVRSYNHKVYTVRCYKNAMRTSNENDKKAKFRWECNKNI